MFESYLDKYKSKGFFVFDFSTTFKDACNAPHDQSGVYLIFKIIEEKEWLVYIGSSGQRNADGSIKHRKGGMKDRLINGYHPNRFGEAKRIKRHIAIPNQMIVEGISAIIVYWWVTYDADHKDFPTDIEKLLERDFCFKNNAKPAWHK